MIGQHYKVKEEILYSYYYALKRTKETNDFAEYIIPRWHIDAHLSVDVPGALAKGMPYWINTKIDWIFDNFKQPKLQYSGHTDSHTILVHAMEQGHQFHSTWTQLGSVTDDWHEYVDEDFLPGKQFLENHPQATKIAQYGRPTLDLYETVWGQVFEQHCAYWIPGWLFSFRPVWRYLFLDQMEESDCTVDGHFKPVLFKKGNDYYWMLTNGFDEYTCLKHPISFFGDGFIPEVAVVQAYLAKQFYQEHLPHLQGGLSLHRIPYGLRPLYNNSLGRVPALTETIAIGTIMSKSNTLSLKNIRCMEEIISLGRMDICHSWNERRQNLIDDLKDVPYGFRLNKTKTPIDNYTAYIECPERIMRIAALYRLDAEGLTEVSPDILNQ